MRWKTLELVQKMFDAEIEKLCDASLPQEMKCYKSGSTPSNIVVEGKKFHIQRPRVRNASGEVRLKSYEAFRDKSVRDQRIIDHVLNGVSMRNYGNLFNEQNGFQCQKSVVSKVFKQCSQKALEQLNNQKLETFDFISLMFDGIEFGGRMVICVLGITNIGQKIPLGIREGDTENTEVCVDLLQSLIDRGLKYNPNFIFVIDGAKALRKSILKIFGEAFPIQRCVRHKERNIKSYLSDTYHSEFYRRWKLLHGCVNYEDALKEYKKLREWLGGINHEALNSLEEAEMETLTILKLNCPFLLRKTLLSTNPIESSFAKIRTMTNRVKNWKSGQNQISRWMATALLEAEKKFRTIKGFKEIPMLEKELKKLPLENQKTVSYA